MSCLHVGSCAACGTVVVPIFVIVVAIDMVSIDK